MSVRKVYIVIIDGVVVHSGSIASCNVVYKAIARYFELFEVNKDVLIAFKQGVK